MPASMTAPYVYFNPRSPRGERLDLRRDTHARRGISTHAPLAGSDEVCAQLAATGDLFQPTLPSRGATKALAGKQAQFLISTHAPLAGSDFID